MHKHRHGSTSPFLTKPHDDRRVSRGRDRKLREGVFLLIHMILGLALDLTGFAYELMESSAFSSGEWMVLRLRESAGKCGARDALDLSMEFPRLRVKGSVPLFQIRLK